MMKIMMRNNSMKETVERSPNDTQHQNNAHPKNIHIDCDEVQLTNAQCYMVPLCILWYREC